MKKLLTLVFALAVAGSLLAQDTGGDKNHHKGTQTTNATSTDSDHDHDNNGQHKGHKKGHKGGKKSKKGSSSTTPPPK